MSGTAFLKVGSNGDPAEERAIQSSAGAGDAGKIPALDSSGRIDPTMMPAGIAAETVSFVASEDIAAGCYVNLFLSGGVLKGRLADNSNGRRADCFVLSAVSTAATGTGYTDGNNTGLSGMTIGSRQFLGTAGGVTETVPAAGSNVIVQILGKAKTETEIITGSFDDVIERVA